MRTHLMLIAAGMAGATLTLAATAGAATRLVVPVPTTENVAKSLTELHGGTLRIRSALSVGTVVMVTLPLRPSPSPPNEAMAVNEVLSLPASSASTLALLH